MKAQSYHYPESEQDLGNGTYFVNTEVEEKTDENGRTYWEYSQELRSYTNTAVPEEVAAWRLRAVTTLADMSQGIEDFLNSLPEPDRTVAKEAWYSGTTVKRESATVGAFQQVFQLSSEEVDNLFIQAANISI
ncbi:hypothetical protein [Runella salmonicolor]|uniref:Uncharacterized protein n=1 Tax=Runella salmonicolor TaxID=2950278 RepID=A0ABT1FSN8_9BACT|nr:hypothetical protein [Runella salmonicolor]MCP1384788.1 hypothetical protein [Runella salmonicolor]